MIIHLIWIFNFQKYQFLFRYCEVRRTNQCQFSHSINLCFYRIPVPCGKRELANFGRIKIPRDAMIFLRNKLTQIILHCVNFQISTLTYCHIKTYTALPK